MTKSTSRDGHKFSQVPAANIQRSSFDRSHGVKTTFDAGRLIPFFIDEVLPGDTFNVRTSGLARLSTPIFPIMDNMFMDTFYFFVPNRLVWDNFVKMMGEEKSPGDSTDYLVPQFTTNPETAFQEDTLADYFGYPTKINNPSVNALPHRAYNLIYNEWFRDENLEDPKDVPTDDGPDIDGLNNGLAQIRAKQHDYFTSALPWPQKGPDIELPLGDRAPIKGLSATDPSTLFTAGTPGIQAQGLTRLVNYPNAVRSGTNQFNMEWSNNNASTGQPAVFADLTNASGATINEFRTAIQVQALYERDARGGTRYTEIVQSHFRVTSPDARLQRPEYLGGGTSPVNINPIYATATTSGETELGDLSAVGTANFSGHGFSKSFTEHGFIIGIVNVRNDVTYQQGLNRMFARRDRFDYYWPELSGIGEQEILNSEIYYQDPTASDVNDEVFGYQERYAEYRYRPSMVTGLMRSNATASLDAWHLAQEFSSLPTLSSDFIRNVPPMDRVLAVPSEPDFIGDFYHKVTCARPMPLYGIPGNIGRF